MVRGHAIPVALRRATVPAAAPRPPVPDPGGPARRAGLVCGRARPGAGPGLWRCGRLCVAGAVVFDTGAARGRPAPGIFAVAAADPGPVVAQGIFAAHGRPRPVADAREL